MELSLKVDSVWKSYAKRPVLAGVALEVRAGECVGIMGRNGSGKTTLARIIAGLAKPDRGGVTVAGGRGQALLVQQDFVVWPHLTVTANVELGLPKGARQEDRQAMHKWLEKMGIAELSQEKAGSLSHGQQQRVSLARALTRRPEVMVLDEVFSNLDAPTREPLLEAIRCYKQEEKTALVWIGHDWREMAGLCERIAVLTDGVVTQEAEPEILYRKPATEEIARLGGALNTLPIERWEALGLPPAGNWRADAGVTGGIRTKVGWRPEDWLVTECTDGVRITCLASRHWGPGYLHVLQLESGETAGLWSQARLPREFCGKFKLREDACVHYLP